MSLRGLNLKFATHSLDYVLQRRNIPHLFYLFRGDLQALVRNSHRELAVSVLVEINYMIVSHTSCYLYRFSTEYSVPSD